MAEELVNPFWDTACLSQSAADTVDPVRDRKYEQKGRRKEEGWGVCGYEASIVE